jgi:hypothetical protein
LKGKMMTLKLPEVPKPDSGVSFAGGSIEYVSSLGIRNYGQACAKAALEEAIKLSEKYNDGRYANCADLIADALRQLSDEIT